MDLFTPASELLYTGHHVEGMELKPEAPPLFLTTAFTMDSFDEVRDVYDRGGYTYIRGGNPNRDMLAETISYLEGGEKTHICASGMGAIASSLYTVLDPFDRIVCNKSCYGEAYELMTLLLSKMQIETDFVDFTDLMPSGRRSHRRQRFSIPKCSPIPPSRWQTSRRWRRLHMKTVRCSWWIIPLPPR